MPTDQKTNATRSAWYSCFWEAGFGPILVATLWLVIFPAVYPTPIGDGVIPNWLFFSPARLAFWFYLLLCPAVALPAGLLPMALRFVIDRRLRGRIHKFASLGAFMFGMVMSCVWPLMIYRANPDGKRSAAHDRQVPVRLSSPTNGSGS